MDIEGDPIYLKWMHHAMPETGSTRAECFKVCVWVTWVDGALDYSFMQIGVNWENAHGILKEIKQIMNKNWKDF